MAEICAAGALYVMRKGLGAIEQAAEIDPNNAGLQRDVAISYGKLAAALRMAGETEAALDALRRAQAIVERMIKLFPDNAGWKRDLPWIPAPMAETTPATPK